MASAQKNSSLNHAAMKTANADIKIAISSTKSNDCILDLEVTNISNKALILYENSHGAILSIQLHDENGILHDIGELEGSSQLRKIPPRETRRFQTKLQRYFRLKPGVWTLDCKVILYEEDGKDARAQMPQLQFKITPETKAK